MKLNTIMFNESDIIWKWFFFATPVVKDILRRCQQELTRSTDTRYPIFSGLVLCHSNNDVTREGWWCDSLLFILVKGLKSARSLSCDIPMSQQINWFQFNSVCFTELYCWKHSGKQKAGFWGITGLVPNPHAPDAHPLKKWQKQTINKQLAWHKQSTSF